MGRRDEHGGHFEVHVRARHLEKAVHGKGMLADSTMLFSAPKDFAGCSIGVEDVS